MGVAGRGDAAADVDELPDAQLRHRGDGSTQKCPVLQCGNANRRERTGDLVAGVPVGLEMVLAAQPVVIATSGVWDRCVNALLRRLAGAFPDPGVLTGHDYPY